MKRFKVIFEIDDDEADSAAVDEVLSELLDAEDQGVRVLWVEEVAV